MLWRVGAHLQPEHIVRIVGHAVAHDDIPVVYALRSQRHASMHRTIVAVLHQDIIAGSVLGCLVSKGALTSLKHHSIIVHIHVAATHHHIVTSVNIDGIRRRSLDALGRGVDIKIKVAHMITTVDMVGPER